MLGFGLSALGITARVGGGIPKTPYLAMNQDAPSQEHLQVNPTRSRCLVEYSQQIDNAGEQT
jgi:hypothetical protein